MKAPHTTTLFFEWASPQLPTTHRRGFTRNTKVPVKNTTLTSVKKTLLEAYTPVTTLIRGIVFIRCPVGETMVK